jgi:hypothetical protein
MRQRGITEAMVEQALRGYFASWPARPLPRTTDRSIVYAGRIGNRDLGVYILVGSDPPVVTTVVWMDQEEQP